MAQFFRVKCPKCGEVFTIAKGVLMSWDFTKPIPEELLDETPFNCPSCNHKMCVQDKDFEKYVLEVMFAD